jgi:hypothetical protein
LQPDQPAGVAQQGLEIVLALGQAVDLDFVGDAGLGRLAARRRLGLFRRPGRRFVGGAAGQRRRQSQQQAGKRRGNLTKQAPWTDRRAG